MKELKKSRGEFEELINAKLVEDDFDQNNRLAFELTSSKSYINKEKFEWKNKSEDRYEDLEKKYSVDNPLLKNSYKEDHKYSYQYKVEDPKLCENKRRIEKDFEKNFSTKDALQKIKNKEGKFASSNEKPENLNIQMRIKQKRILLENNLDDLKKRIGFMKISDDQFCEENPLEKILVCYDDIIMLTESKCISFEFKFIFFKLKV